MPNSRSRDPRDKALVALLALAAVNAQEFERLGETEEAESTIALAENVCKMLDAAGAPVPTDDFVEMCAFIVGGE